MQSTKRRIENEATESLKNFLDCNPLPCYRAGRGLVDLRVKQDTYFQVGPIMFKRILLAAVVLSLCSTNGYAQQVFTTFGQGSNAASTGTVNASSGTGSFFIYSAGDYQFDAFDLEFSVADNSVIEFTNAELFNSTISAGPGLDLGVRFNENVLSETTANSGRLVGISITEQGINPAGASFDEDFDALVANPDGSSVGSFLLAQVDYDIVGSGTVDINLELGELEFFSFSTPTVLIQPTLGSGTLTVASTQVTSVPEPSTMGISSARPSWFCCSSSSLVNPSVEYRIRF